MDTATMSTRKLAIDGMSGDTCVKNVTGALKGVQGVSTTSVEVGSATIQANKDGCDAACKAIGTAGYKAREGSSSAPVGGAEHASAKHDMKPEATSGSKQDQRSENKMQMPGAVANQSGSMGSKQSSDAQPAATPTKAAH